MCELWDHYQIAFITLVKTIPADLTIKHPLLRQNITEINMYFYTNIKKI